MAPPLSRGKSYGGGAEAEDDFRFACATLRWSFAMVIGLCPRCMPALPGFGGCQAVPVVTGTTSWQASRMTSAAGKRRGSPGSRPPPLSSTLRGFQLHQHDLEW
jgi:hypothetical protein